MPYKSLPRQKSSHAKMTMWTSPYIKFKGRTNVLPSKSKGQKPSHWKKKKRKNNSAFFVTNFLLINAWWMIVWCQNFLYFIVIWGSFDTSLLSYMTYHNSINVNHWSFFIHVKLGGLLSFCYFDWRAFVRLPLLFAACKTKILNGPYIMNNSPEHYTSQRLQ